MNLLEYIAIEKRLMNEFSSLLAQNLCQKIKECVNSNGNLIAKHPFKNLLTFETDEKIEIPETLKNTYTEEF